MSLELPPTKIVCVGRNYSAHAAEMGSAVPAEPLLFLKPPSALIPSGEPILMPGWAGRVDYEGEIGVQIGRRARRVGLEEAAGCVRAYLPLNDVTARTLQKSDGQWSRAKGMDTFCPVGEPVPAGEVDPAALAVTTRVNGVERQRASVERMVFDIPFLVAYISSAMTLEPGDIIATGTPEGIGPLEDGDEVEVEVDGVGRVVSPVRADPDAPPPPEAGHVS